MRHRRASLAGLALLALASSASVAPASAQGLSPARRSLTPIAAPPPATPAATPAASPADTPAETPFLRIDAGFHTAVVNGFAQDRNGRIIVTVSDDKTARIWQSNNGALLATLRVPIAAGDEGALYAAGLSPDGKTLLLAGNTGATWDGGLYCLYLFDTESGKLRGRLPNLPGPVNDIAYAPDGRSFAIGMGKGGGVWLLDATNGSTIGSDGSFRQPVTSVAFDARGRLYATGYDGDVRAYDAGGRRVAARTPVRDGRPYRLAVSPDGRSVAVGYVDQPLVMVLNAQDLSTRARLDTDPAGQRLTGAAGLGAVTWLADGSLVAAGSLRGPDGKTLLRRWAGGTGRPGDISGTGDTVFELGPTPDGGLILVGAGPALARIGPTGQTVFSKSAPGLDFRDLPDRQFSLSADGLALRLQTKETNGPWVLDMGQRRVGPATMTATRALTPVAAPTTAPAGPPIDIANWRNSANPLVAGRPVALDRDERARAAAAAPNGSFAVIGTDYALRVYRADGALVGQADVPGAAWAVAISGDSRVVVAGIGDGTLRWFGLSPEGRLTPRMSMFLAADLRRWVAWNDAGYFDYSDAGGETLVGLQLNRARNQLPQWFSFAQVFRRYFSPDLVAASLRGTAPVAPGGATEIRQAITQSPPPGVELAGICWTQAGAARQCQTLAASKVTRSLVPIAAPTTAAAPETADATVPDGVASITLQFRLVAPKPAPSAVDLFVNGRNAGRVVQQVAAPEQLFEQPAVIDAGVNTIQLRAYDGQQQTYAESRTVRVARAKAAETVGSSPAAPAQKPTLFLLAVGINKYSPRVGRLTYAVADARAVAAAIRTHLPSRYAKIEEIDLYDEDGTSTRVLQAMDDIAAKATGQDTVLIYVSAHGTMLDDQRYFLITQNVASAYVGDIVAGGISEQQLVKALGKIGSSNTMLFLDTCHAGGFSLDSASKLAHETGRYILAAASTKEEAADSFDDVNGVFATAVLRGLAGKAAEGRTTVDNFGLGFYVQPLVEELAKEADPTHTQRARFKVDTDNAIPFPIATVPAPQ